MKNLQQKTKTNNIIVPETHCPTPSGPSSSSGCLSAWHTVPTLSAVSLQEPANTSFCQLFLFRNLLTPHHFISCLSLGACQHNIILSAVPLQEPANTPFCQLLTYQLTSLSCACSRQSYQTAVVYLHHYFCSHCYYQCLEVTLYG